MSEFDLDAELESDDSVGLETEDRKHIKSNREEWFKGEKGVKYRASLIYFYPLQLAGALELKKKFAKEGKGAPTKEQMVEVGNMLLAKRAGELGKPVDQLQPHETLLLTTNRFKKVVGIYKDGLGYVLDLKDEEKSEAKFWAELGQSKPSFCSILLLYPCNPQGEVDKGRFLTDYRIMPWRASSKSYESLIDKADSLSSNGIEMSSQDIELKCTNKEFQNFDIEPKGKALWRSNAKFQAKILEESLVLYDKLNPFKRMTASAIRTKLGMTSTSTPSAGSETSMEEFAGLLDGV